LPTIQRIVDGSRPVVLAVHASASKDIVDKTVHTLDVRKFINLLPLWRMLCVLVPVY
jgi:hypothetical protein